MTNEYIPPSAPAYEAPLARALRSGMVQGANGAVTQAPRQNPHPNGQPVAATPNPGLQPVIPGQGGYTRRFNNGDGSYNLGQVPTT